MHLVLLLVVVSRLWTATQAATKYAPNHFLGSCLDQAWVDRVHHDLGISDTDRDAYGRRLDPYLHAALKIPRFTVRFPLLSIETTETVERDLQI